MAKQIRQEGKEMSKYFVSWTESTRYVMEVESDNPDAAFALAYDRAIDEDISISRVVKREVRELK